MFCCYFIAFLRSIFNFQRFKCKNEPHSLSTSEIIDSERRGYSNALRSFFWKPFRSQRVNESQKLKEKQFYPTFSSFWAKMSWKKSFLVRSDILGLLVNTFTADNEYFRNNREIFLLPIYMQLSQKPTTFCCFLIAFLESPLNFEPIFFYKWAS